MRSCDELGVCAGRTPRCKGCEPLRASVFQGLLGYRGDAIRIMRDVPEAVEFWATLPGKRKTPGRIVRGSSG